MHNVSVQRRYKPALAWGGLGEIWARLVINLKFYTVNWRLTIDLFGPHHVSMMSECRKSSKLLRWLETGNCTDFWLGSYTKYRTEVLGFNYYGNGPIGAVELFTAERGKKTSIILQCKQLLFTKLINDPTMAIHVHWEIPICIKLKEKWTKRQTYQNSDWLTQWPG